MRDAPLPDGNKTMCITSFPRRHRRTNQTKPMASGRNLEVSMQGTVKFFNADKGYGFITPDDDATDIFVHISAVERSGMTTLQEGQKIEFDVEPDKKGKGPKAIDLKIL